MGHGKITVLGRAAEGMTRRAFLRDASCSIALLSIGLKGCAGARLHEASGRPVASSAAPDGRLPILWVEAGVCTGCAVSLLSTTQPVVEDVLDVARIEFQETLSDEAGSRLVDRLRRVAQDARGEFVLVVDGAIPTGACARMTVVGVDGSGRELTAQGLIEELVPQAGLIVALGTCASFGGVAAAANHVTSSVPLGDLVGERTIVRIPGCPPQPTWIAGTLAGFLGGEVPSLDELGRPLEYFAETLHQRCPRKAAFDAGEFAVVPGEPERCLFAVGCKGPMTKSDCGMRLWHGRSSCIRVGHPCMGCTSSAFPDARGGAGVEVGVAAAPFYRPLQV